MVGVEKVKTREKPRQKGENHIKSEKSRGKIRKIIEKDQNSDLKYKILAKNSKNFKNWLGNIE